MIATLTPAQRRAADPSNSAWLMANAGSGKTSVLIDRVVRLLLDGTPPQRILCLTYTKAAASEMQNRLFQRLGGWSMLADGDLRKTLADLGATGKAGDAPALAAARRLFAQAIETPGGLKIQTIHSFCAGLLRRFPVEARVPPGFTELDEFQTTDLRAAVAEQLASGSLDDIAAVDGLAGLTSDKTFPAILAEICVNRDAYRHPQSRSSILAELGQPTGISAEGVVASVFDGSETDLFATAIPVLARESATMRDLAQVLLDVLARPRDLSALDRLSDSFLYRKDGVLLPVAKTPSIPTKKATEALGDSVQDFHALMHRVAAARDQLNALAAADQTLALHRFATAYLPLYTAAKAERGWLDFDDLIRKAADLLTDRSVAAWVLWRLDGGIDHILVDEAQDTSPAQWGVIERLTEEIIAGSGAADRSRTIFVVGDPKQSIYSFQGADLAEFTAKHRHFKTWLASPGRGLIEDQLLRSYRSSQAILRAVDLTFRLPAQVGLGDTPPEHLAHFGDMPGRVDLWPAIEKPAKAEPADWIDPAHTPTEPNAEVKLANRIASELRRMIDAGTQIPRKDGTSRRMHEGDVLILVRRRRGLFNAIIKACKSACLSVAGADRMTLGDELAVHDILALLSFLALPEDDLSLAAALRSPLFGWSEGMLYSLAQPRGDRTYLWAELRDRQTEFGETYAILRDLRDRSEFLRPYELIERVLIRHDGRRRLLARMGSEVEDAIDELLTQALIYEQADVPSLTGFLGRLSSGEVEVKRRLSSTGQAIRVMTVHGAKGLEAPVVILPESGDWKLEIKNQTLGGPTDIPLWRGAANELPEALRTAKDAALAKITEERMRLLYVAMTRAQSWLIVCAAGDAGPGDKSWHGLIAHGLAGAGAADVPGPDGILIRRLGHRDWPSDLGPIGHDPAHAGAVLPDWTQNRAAPVPAQSVALNPSEMPGPKVLSGPPSPDGLPFDTDRAKAFGTALHRLLEHLPLWPQSDWQAIAETLLTESESHGGSAEAELLLQAARRVLLAPGLRALLARRALTEVELTGTIAALGGARVHGTIDRLIVADDHVLAVDYKSNAIVPRDPQNVPEGILRQMGCYAALLADLYPERRIETAILWTTTATLMPLPPDIVRSALQSTPIP
jgi:ATP-dependent helicase/nuclease subunit A